jgi:hypothetical protein
VLATFLETPVPDSQLEPENTTSAPFGLERNAAWEISSGGLISLILQADLQLPNGFVCGSDGVLAVPSEVVRRFLQVPFGILKSMDRAPNFRMPPALCR